MAEIIAEIWKFFDNTFKIFLSVGSQDIVRKILGWQDCQVGATYFYHDGVTNDIIFPSQLYNRIAGVVGLAKKKKSIVRVKNGQELAKKNKNNL